MGEEPATISAGRIASPHGLDGSFKVADPEARLLRVGASVDVAGVQRAIERLAGTPARPIVRLEGVGDRDSAAALRGQHLQVPREAAPELGEDEWWSSDLIGCSVVDGAAEVGTVRDVVGLPSCEALDVERASAQSLLVPLISDAVREVNTERRKIDIDLAFLGEEQEG